MQNTKYKILNTKRGFTLIETLVAAGIFIVVVTASINAFLFVSRLNRLLSSSFSVTDNINSTLEIISRDIRMAQPRSGQAMFTFNPANPSVLQFTNYKNQDVIYRLNNKAIEKEVVGTPPSFPLTSVNVEVESLTFNVSGNVVGDNLQPMVRIFLKFKRSQGEDNIINYLQTAVSPRNLDI